MNMRRIANAAYVLLPLTIFAVSSAAGQTGGQPSLADLRAACADDAQRLCAGVQPGGGRVVACLKEHKDALSDRCKKAAGLPVNPASSAAPSKADSPPSAAPAPAAPSTTAGTSTSAAATTDKTGAGGAVSTIGGEKFVERIIPDPDHGGMRAATIHIPEKWSFESKIEWHYDRLEVPL
ncbi:MAG TPA: cysteine rich repeat-containing protein, partial [Chthonomonadales bacterium]|nr:cysteine rich repeat-containing protein [Chthonomonadales bacterium]